MHVEPDRAKAIRQAIDDARPGDVVLVAGKGHERGQTIGTTTLPFSDAEAVLEALEGIEEKGLSAEQQCRKDFAAGLASRKLRRYSSAEKNLSKVVERCKDEDLLRRATYLKAKVVSIRGGLRAIPIIDAFAERFKGHTMVEEAPVTKTMPMRASSCPERGRSSTGFGAAGGRVSATPFQPSHSARSEGMV